MNKNYLFGLLLIISFSYVNNINAQKGFRLGIAGGVGIQNSKALDTTNVGANLKTYFGPSAWILAQYGISESFAFSLKTGIMNQGSKIALDSFGSSLNLSRINLTNDLGITFKQKINEDIIMRENFGFSFSYDLSKSDSINKASTLINSNYFLSDTRLDKFMPAFHLGVEVGKQNPNGDLFTVGVNYRQTFGTTNIVKIFEGSNSIKSYSRSGSFVSVSLNYYFNLANFKKTEEFFY